MEYLLMFLLVVTGLFLILIVLIQRGRGGGLAGAFGGAGGQSAFGTKAGDLFTRVTIGVAAFWIILCAVSVKFLANNESLFTNAGTSSATPGAAGKTEEVPAKGTGAASSEKTSTDKSDTKATPDQPAAGGSVDAPAAATQGTATPAAVPTAEAPATASPPAEAPAEKAPAEK
jgi:preprotein translocase subunit SecG